MEIRFFVWEIFRENETGSILKKFGNHFDMADLNKINHDLDVISHFCKDYEEKLLAAKIVHYEATLLFEMTTTENRECFWSLISLIQSMKAKFGRKNSCNVYQAVLEKL